MAPRINFKEDAKAATFRRQRGLCAVCGRSLNELLRTTDMQAMHAHHVLPAALGGDGSVDNCVYLCGGDKSEDPDIGSSHPDGCHYRVHAEGDYRSGVTAPPSYYTFSHAGDISAHAAWVRRMNKILGLPHR